VPPSPWTSPMRNISVSSLVLLVLLVFVPRTAQSATKTYVGSDVCQTCHEDIFKAFQKDPHKVVDLDKTRGRENHACEGCHGPGGAHIETLSTDDIVNPT